MSVHLFWMQVRMVGTCLYTYFLCEVDTGAASATPLGDAVRDVHTSWHQRTCLGCSCEVQESGTAQVPSPWPANARQVLHVKHAHMTHIMTMSKSHERTCRGCS